MMNRRKFVVSMAAAGVALKRKPIFAGADLDTAPEIVVTLRDAHKGTPTIDMNLLNSYGRQPESIRAFFAEARAVFEADRQMHWQKTPPRSSSDEPPSKPSANSNSTPTSPTRK